MRGIKFRQPIFNKDGSFNYWHYWGFIKLYEQYTYVGPETHYSTIEQALKTSQPFIGYPDKTGREIYEKDWVRHIGADQTEPMHRPPVTSIRLVENKGKFGYPIFQGIHEKLWEVIGNITENPEISKEPK